MFKKFAPKNAARYARFAQQRHDLIRYQDESAGLDNPSLGLRLLTLARTLRNTTPDKDTQRVLNNPFGCVYDSNLLWHVIPNMARRLGLRGQSLLKTHEGGDKRAARLSGSDYKTFVVSYIDNNNIAFSGAKFADGEHELFYDSAQKLNPLLKIALTRIMDHNLA